MNAGFTMFVRDGQNGYIINPDQASLVDAMKKYRPSQSALDKMSATSQLTRIIMDNRKMGEYVYQNNMFTGKVTAIL